MLLIFSSSLGEETRSLPGIQRIWKARSRIVSRGPGGEEPIEPGMAGATAEAMLLLPLVWEESAEERPWADVQPSMNWVS
jgi:hypothetical protein